MSAAVSRGRVRRPWHLWLIAVAVFALYLGGARDYVLILANDTEYIETQFGSDGIAYFADYPLVLRAVWTVNILAGLIAPVLLIARSPWAAVTAISAAAAQIALLLATFGFLDRWALLGPALGWFDIGIGVITALFAGYSWVTTRRDSSAQGSGR